MSATVIDLISNLDDAWKKQHHISTMSNKTLVEACFLGNCFSSDCIRTENMGEGEITADAYGRTGTYQCDCITVSGEDTTNGPTGESLRFNYFGNSFSADERGLIILDIDDNVLYWREVGQDPRTEWLINCLADDFEDERGRIVFVGEPVTF